MTLRTHTSPRLLLLLLPLLFLLPSVCHAGEEPTGNNPETGKPAQDTTKPEPPSAHMPSKAQMQAGKQFFVRGQELFKEGKYEAAWIEFSSAHEIAPLPDLVFNMARCEVKMNRLKEAIAHYQEFLATKPDDPESERIRDEIARLDRQINGIPDPTPEAPPPPPPPPKKHFPVASTILGGGAVLFVVIGGISTGVATSTYNGLLQTCQHRCSDSQVQSVRTPLNAGYAMFGLAAVAAVATAVVLPFELGVFHKEKDHKVALRIGPGSLEIAGRF
jgi:tetratricopeptide (TPR) repeat protein